MKKLILAGVMGIISATLQANVPTYGYPGKLYNIGVAVGYSGFNMKSHDWFEDESFNGVFLNLEYHSHPKASIWAEYSYMKDEFWASEGTVGYKYKFYETNELYTAGSLGLGYAYLEDKENDSELGKTKVELKYITVPFYAELGFKPSEQVDLFGTLGYKWMYNRKARVCMGGDCAAAKLHAVDLDGLIYKLGVRYNF